MQFYLNILIELFPFLQFSELREAFDNRNVGETPTAVFPPQNVRFGMIKSERQVNVGVVLSRGSVGFDVGAGLPGVQARALTICT